MTETLPLAILKSFQTKGIFESAEVLKRGNLNLTVVSKWKDGVSQRRYVHQRINTSIFKRPEVVMRNIERILAHFHQSPDKALRSLVLVPANTGQSWINDPVHGAWRTYEFVEGTVAYDFCPNASVAGEAAAALAWFQKQLLGLKVEDFEEAIPRFVDFSWRVKALEESIEANLAGRVTAAAKEIAQARVLAKMILEIDAQIRSGSILRRVCNCDPKMNNVLFEPKTGRAACVVDLDVVGPGNVTYDFGDFVRGAGFACPEDEQDFSKVVLNRPYIEAIARGYIGKVGPFLLPGEVQSFSVAPKLIAANLGIRFLTDHLNGDKYFRAERPTHNLDRTRTQFQIAGELARSESWLKEIVKVSMAST